MMNHARYRLSIRIFILLLFLPLLGLTCERTPSLKERVDVFVSTYLEEQYDDDFILKEVTGSLIGLITVYAYPVNHPQEHFVVYLKQYPDLRLDFEDYNLRLVERELRTRVTELMSDTNVSLQYRLTPRLSHINFPYGFRDIRSSQDAAVFLNSDIKGFWTMYISVLSSKADYDVHKEDIERIFEAIEQSGVQDYDFEINFYDPTTTQPTATIAIEDLEYNPFFRPSKGYVFPENLRKRQRHYEGIDF